MSIETTVKCDICGVVKQQANRWWRVKVFNYENDEGEHLTVFHSDAVLVEPNKDVCGQSCLHRLIDRWMETGSLDKLEKPQAQPAQESE
jgi:hypothetical protein